MSAIDPLDATLREAHARGHVALWLPGSGLTILVAATVNDGEHTVDPAALEAFATLEAMRVAARR